MAILNPSFEDAGTLPGEAEHWTLSAVTSVEAEIREVLLWASLPPCVERRVVCGGCALATARSWHGYGFTPAEVEAWLRVGVYEPPVAAELRGEGWGATSWPFRDLEFVGLIVGIALSDGHLMASEVRDLVDGRLE